MIFEPPTLTHNSLLVGSVLKSAVYILFYTNNTQTQPHSTKIRISSQITNPPQLRQKKSQYAFLNFGNHGRFFAYKRVNMKTQK